jgi:hypothetical protein
VTGYFSNLLHYTRASGHHRGVVRSSLPTQTSDPTPIVEQHERVLINGDRSTVMQNHPSGFREDAHSQGEIPFNPGSKLAQSTGISVPQDPDQLLESQSQNEIMDSHALEVGEEFTNTPEQDQRERTSTDSIEQHVTIERREQSRSKDAAQPVVSSQEGIESPERHATIQIRPSEQPDDQYSRAGLGDGVPPDYSGVSEIEQIKEARPAEAKLEQMQDVDERQVIWKQVYQDVRTWVADSPEVETVLDRPDDDREEIHITARTLPQIEDARTIPPAQRESKPAAQPVDTQELELSIGSINVTIEVPESHTLRSAPQAGNLDKGEPPSSLSRDYLRLR